MLYINYLLQHILLLNNHQHFLLTKRCAETVQNLMAFIFKDHYNLAYQKKPEEIVFVIRYCCQGILLNIYHVYTKYS